jgi:hypothetical protein
MLAETLGSDLVTDGTFDTLGSELITNGDFTNWTGDDPDNWSIYGSGEDANNYVTEVAGKAQIVSDGTLVGISQSSLTTGKWYKASVEVTAAVSGKLQVADVTGATVYQDNINAVQTYTFYFKALDTAFIIKRGGVCDITIDNVTVKEIGADWTWGDGWNPDGSVADCDGTQSANSGLIQESVTGGTAGDVYKVTFDLTRSAGNLKLWLGTDGWNYSASTTGDLTSAGSYVYYLTVPSAGSDTDSLRLRANVDFVGTVDNVVVKKVTNDSRGTMVVDWTPGVDYDQGPASQSGIVTSNEANDATLLYYSGTANDRFRSNDNVSAPYEALQFTAGTTYRWSVRWGINNSNVRQFEPGLIIGGAVTTDFTTDYDGAYVLGTLLLLGRSLAFPFNVKNLQFFSGAPLTDAELLAL